MPKCLFKEVQLHEHPSLMNSSIRDGKKEVKNVHLFHTEAPFPFNDTECETDFRTNFLFAGVYLSTAFLIAWL